MASQTPARCAKSGSVGRAPTSHDSNTEERMDFADIGPHQAMTTKTEISPAPSTINNGENTTDKRIQDAQEGWTTVVSIRERKMQRRERAQEHQKNDSPKNADKPKFRPRRNGKKLPPLPKDDFKVIVRPHQGLPLRAITTPVMARAIIEACDEKIQGEQFLLRIKPGSNIVIVSTPEKEVANTLRQITSLKINGKPHAVKAYVALGDGAVRGVIHGLTPHTPSDVLKSKIRVRTLNVEVAHARMLGDSKSAVIVFFGNLVPRYVYYEGGEMACYPFRNTVQVCKTCQRVGHRTDVCPQPELCVCRICGTEDPADGHECNPKCASCGEAHLTGDRSCRKRLKQVRRPEPSSGRQARMPSKERRLKSKHRWFESEEEEQGYTTEGSIPFDQENFPEVHRQETGRGPVKSKLKNATPQHPQSRETIGQPQMAAPKVSWAQVAAPTAQHQTNHKSVADQKLIEENRSLKASLAELKKEMAALKQTIHDLANKTKEASTTQVIKPIPTPEEPMGKQLETIAHQVQIMFAELHALKRHVDDSLSSIKVTTRKRINDSPGAPSRRPKVIETTDSDSTIHG